MSRPRRTIGTIAVCVLLSSAASAQEGVAPPPIPIAELAAGYAFVLDSADDFHGWIASGAVNLTQWLGVVGEIAGVYDSTDVPMQFSQNNRVFTFLAGPRFFRSFGGIVPFGQFLVGAAHRTMTGEAYYYSDGPRGFGDSNTHAAIQPGGGVTILLPHDVGLRIGVDYRQVLLPAAYDSDARDVRFTTGFAFGWGVR